MKKIVKKLAKKTFGDVYDTLVLPKHFVVAVLANLKRGFPAKGIKVIGVTGTNGKTSTAFLIHSVLCQAGIKTGLMTTVAYGLGKKVKPQIQHMTTQSIDVTLNRIMEMKKQGLEWLVLEVTSQALVQFRILGIPIDIAVMTNVTHEHLDYHKTFANYLKAKLRLFRLANRYRKGRRLGVINGDDENAAAFVDAIKNAVVYSGQPGTDATIARPSSIKLTPTSSSYTLKIKDDSYKIICNLPGSFNVDNSMAAALCGRALGLSRQDIETGVSALKEVEGRMTSIEEGQPFAVIVDFAHTPDSFEKLFKDLRPLVKGRLIAMFGSAGRRDKLKRPLMGKIAAQQADFLVLTEEDDRDEDGQLILEEIAQGAARGGKNVGQNVFLVHDRLQAIKKALSLAQSKGDLVILLGKGHEKSIIRADGEHAWNEIGSARRLLKQRLKKKVKA